MAKLTKISRHYWKERLKISKIAQFESDLLKINEATNPQSPPPPTPPHENL